MSGVSDGRIRIQISPEVHDEERILDELGTALREDPPRIPSRHFYDERGSRLFDQITRLEEYYPTRSEAALLAEHADRIVARASPRCLVELGSGSAAKTRRLLDAMAHSGSLERYVPFDISEEPLRRSAVALAADYPQLRIDGLVGDFSAHLDDIPAADDRLVIFLGGTIGNFEPEARESFLTALAAVMEPGEHFLLGVDRIKDRRRLEAAYNDRAGVTAAFNRNILAVVNDLTGGDFDPAAFRHRAIYDTDAHRIEMWLDSRLAQSVRLPALDLALDLEPGDSILTEISTKYDLERVDAMLARNGFRRIDWMTDSEGLFGLALAERL
ncbi:MAG: L-histidine N(alpha)-methyltransferase [Thermoanaerobaculia bacterium]|nr:L-histidine N(alpha)-methyltransferase [Thermoanaerobaculia bacterium]